MKLRLLVTKKCKRNCEGCCNKDWDLDGLPVQSIDESLQKYDEIMITGGEPLLFPYTVKMLIKDIKDYSNAKIFIYTADQSKLISGDILPFVNGITLTLHEKKDEELFSFVDTRMNVMKLENKSLRLNVFEGINVNPSSLWIVKNNIQWIKNCPLPKDEEFKRLNTLL